MFTSMRVENDVAASDMSIVYEFPDVFPKDIGDLPLEREIEFTINLVPDIRLVSLASYRMFASKLGELKEQLEDLLEKKFVRPKIYYRRIFEVRFTFDSVDSKSTNLCVGCSM